MPIPAPRVAGPFLPVYRPGPDRFPGPDSEHLRAGQPYEDWIPNDHCLVKGSDGAWHMFGITAPASPTLHEGEWCAFHAVATAGALAEQLRPGAFRDVAKVLAPADRPGDGPRELWGPWVVTAHGRYHMFFGPGVVRHAVSADLSRWVLIAPAFRQTGAARDICILPDGAAWRMVYVAGGSVWTRSSDDLVAWSDPPVEMLSLPDPATPESPFLLSRGGCWYLFYCIYDGSNGPYDNRTFVLASDDPDRFQDAEPIARLRAHAPEVVTGEDGRTWITSAEWPARGVGLAPLAWD